jgi:hypothetical protein
MSLHVPYQHQCQHCGAGYIPYDQSVPCPNCGRVEEERFDYISWAAASLLANKRETGVYTPRGWAVTSLGDQILFLLFGILDAYAAQRGCIPFGEFAAARLARVHWGEHGYLQGHVEGIAVRVNELLERARAGHSLPALVPSKRRYEYHCPECKAGLERRQQTECPHCGWLKYPSAARENWGKVGPCPQCAFSYRWDGSRCSHCGHVPTA